MIARLESDPSKEQALQNAIELIEQLLDPQVAATETAVPRDSLSTLVQKTTDLTLATNDVATTRRMLTVLDNANLVDEEYTQLRGLLHEKLTLAEIGQQIDKLLSEAEEHLAGDRLSMPEGRNALFSFRQVQTLDPENALAANGIKRIEARYVALIDQALANNRLSDATAHIDTLARVSPTHASLPSLREKLELVEENARQEQARRVAEAARVPEQPKASPEPRVAESSAEALDDDESRLWNQVRRSCNQTDLRTYINSYPSGRYVQAAWQRISDCLAAE